MPPAPATCGEWITRIAIAQRKTAGRHHRLPVEDCGARRRRLRVFDEAMQNEKGEGRAEQHFR